MLQKNVYQILQKLSFANIRLEMIQKIKKYINLYRMFFVFIWNEEYIKMQLLIFFIRGLFSREGY